ncbi:hypothetical protein GCM10012278_55700 [Nonomuraea glycinis]|uniref:Uncharacterized protein n=1 Tax=Nonomuraea glycinis TaxID=2047744 RepID=A0A918AC54_9ACTN|nr:hypothetical protein GCM10012278_55700 [Nonomuraea glycinis]
MRRVQGCPRFLRLFGLLWWAAADLGLCPNAEGQSASIELDVEDGRLVAYGLTGEYVIIDLTKIQ